MLDAVILLAFFVSRRFDRYYAVGTVAGEDQVIYFLCFRVSDFAFCIPTQENPCFALEYINAKIR